MVVGAVPGVAMPLRGEDDELVARTLSGGEDVTFDFEVRVKGVAGSDAPRFLGPFVFGSPAQRFVYIRIGTLADQPESCWMRAAKVPIRELPGR